jgi:hypothetical protein
MNTVTGVLFPNPGLSNHTSVATSPQVCSCLFDCTVCTTAPGGDPLYPSSVNDSHRNRFCLFSVLFLHDPLARHVSSSLPGMDEDGSFIGKYAKNRNPEQSSAFATLV